MGQFEKIVVLTVLFLVSVILVISMRSEDGDLLAGAAAAGVALEGPGQTELEVPPAPVRLQGLGATDTMAGGPVALPEFDEIVENEVATEAGAPAANEAGEAPREGRAVEQTEKKASEWLLSSTIGAVSAPEKVAPVGLPRGSALVSVAGLEEVLPGGDRLYTWRAGDSFAKLAQRYYGNPRAVELLRRANEGRGEIVAGEQIWVPVHAERAEGVAVGGEEGDFTLYVVGEGDSLWNIARRHYGAGDAYLRIFDANREALVDIDAVLAPGTELRLP
ncbi:MAG: hypothetical protein CMJ84_09950 [Planctomycetes bacterium]|jgi:nucleoid-associated protein YgaU|nr:hypothetical protein [Planctomycetota bacterium]MDP6408702.1 LysM peptidoglycan-binding domain-containing protein [Planctomycetota bacterium]